MYESQIIYAIKQTQSINFAHWSEINLQRKLLSKGVLFLEKGQTNEQTSWQVNIVQKNILHNFSIHRASR